MIDDDEYEPLPPRRPLFRRKRVLIPLAVLLVIAAIFLALRTPDTDRDAMIAKYGGPDASFAARSSTGKASDERRLRLSTDPSSARNSARVESPGTWSNNGAARVSTAVAAHRSPESFRQLAALRRALSEAAGFWADSASSR